MRLLKVYGMIPPNATVIKLHSEKNLSLAFDKKEFNSHNKYINTLGRYLFNFQYRKGKIGQFKHLSCGRIENG